MVKSIEISSEFIESLEQLKAESKLIDDLVRVPGTNFLMPLLNHLIRGAEGFEQQLVQQLEDIIFREFMESHTKIKSVLFNHMVVRMKKDPEFMSRVVSNFKSLCARLIHEGESGAGIFSNTVLNVQLFRTLAWCLDMTKLKDEVIDAEFLHNLLRLNHSTTVEFCKVLKDMSYVTFKQIELMIENLKMYAYCIETKFYETIISKNADLKKIVDDIYPSLVGLFSDGPRLNRDILLYTCHLVYHNEMLKGNTEYKQEYFSNSHQLEGDAVHVVMISKAKAFVNYPNSGFLVSEKIVPQEDPTLEKQSILEALIKYAHFSQINIKQGAFRVLEDYLRRIQREENLRVAFRENAKIRDEIFEIIIQSWEFPIRGFSNFMEDLFSSFVKCMYIEELPDLLDKIHEVCKAPTRRKFASTKILLKHMPLEKVFEKNPGLLRELLSVKNKGNESASVALFREILTVKYLEITQEIKRTKRNKRENLSNFVEHYQKWVDFWVEDLILVMKEVDERTAIEIVEFVFPPAFEICGEGIVLALNRFIEESSESENILAGKVGLIKLLRTEGLLVINQARTDYTVDHLKSKIDWNTELRNLVVHSNRYIALDAIRAVTEPRKSSEAPLAWEYEIYALIFKFQFKNSYPHFRNDLNVLIQKLLQRLRSIVNPELKKIKSKEDFDHFLGSSENFRLFVGFLEHYKQLFVSNVYPDAPFESSYPFLWSFETLLDIFRNESYMFKSGNMFEPTQVLRYADFYNEKIFEILISSFKCQWDIVRKQCFNILKMFPSDMYYFNKNFLEDQLINPCKDLFSSPIIKDVEAATYSYALAFEIESSMDQKFIMIDEMVQSLHDKKQKMEEAFLEGKAEFSQNLYHGILTTLGITICDESNFKILFKHDKDRLSAIYKRLIHLSIEVINFAKTIISVSEQTFILDNEDTRNQILKIRAKEYKKIIEKLESANTLLDATTEGDEEEEINSDNISAVAFYLVSKESGALFSKITHLVGFTEAQEIYKGTFDVQDIKNLVENFTESLLSIKHLGAIDNVANGLTTLCRNLYEVSGSNYAQLVQDMTKKIILSLKNNQFDNIFRRSAGLPSALTALMKAEPRGNRINLLPYCVEQLLEIAGDTTAPDIARIHSLNILKYTFQDSELKMDLEHYIGKGLMLAIIGFTDNDWSIRNSSLMLYSAILGRLFPKGNEERPSFKNKLNIIQFFIRAPNLIKFFAEEIQKFKNSDQFNQYPSLYPICLIFSKLLPYDMKDDSVECNNKELETVEDLQLDERRIILPSEIKTFKNLLLDCTGHQNYLGRVLVARAMVPFIPVNKMVAKIDDLIIGKRKDIKKDHNKAQGLLLVAKFVLSNFLKISKNSNYGLELDVSTQEIYEGLMEVLAAKQKAYTKLACTPVFLNFVEILLVMMENQDPENGLIFKFEKFAPTIQRCVKLLEAVMKGDPIRSAFDVCESELVDRIIKLVFKYYSDTHGSQEQFGIVNLVDTLVSSKIATLDNEDTNPLVSYFQTLCDLPDETFKKIATKERVKVFLTAALEILKTKNRAINLVEHLLRFISRAVIENVFTDLESISKIILQILQLSFAEQYRENSNIVEEIIPISPRFIFHVNSEDQAQYFEILAKMMSYYSQSDQKDNLRYACAEALGYLVPQIELVLKTDIDIFLTLMECLVTLLTDEYAEIRLFASRLVKEKGQKFSFNDNKSLTILFNIIFDLIMASGKTDDSAFLSKVRLFVFKMVSDQKLENFKFMSAYNTRIFSFDKPNKYKEDAKVIISMYNAILSSGIDLKLIREQYETYLKEYEVPQPQNYELELKHYFANLFARNEFIFSKGMQNYAISMLIGDNEEGREKDYFGQFFKQKSQ